MDAKAAWALGVGSAVEVAPVDEGAFAVTDGLVTLGTGVDAVAGAGGWLACGWPIEVELQAASTSTALPAATSRFAGVIC
ncbi:MAG: hypothetical protein M3N95_16410 [Actinomycetota bacterium]|nr:hypothetical protein [Actinomycetota bacterium]